MNQAQLKKIDNKLNIICGNYSNSLISNLKEIPDDLQKEYDELYNIYWLMSYAKSILVYHQSVDTLNKLIQMKDVHKYQDKMSDEDFKMALLDMLETFKNAEIIQNVYKDNDGITYNSVAFDEATDNDWVNNYEHRIDKLYDKINQIVNKNKKPPAKAKNKVKEWYTNNYPDDSIGEELNPDITFHELWETLEKEPDDFYDQLGEGDSLVRERVFKELAKIYKVTYNDVYEMWMV